jgi:hypothetical protein
MPETNVLVGVAEDVRSVFQVTSPVLGAVEEGEGGGKDSMGALSIVSACRTTGFTVLMGTILVRRCAVGMDS